MDLMLRLNKIEANASIKDEMVYGSTSANQTSAVVSIDVVVEKHDNLGRNVRMNNDIIADWLGHLEDTQGSANWPRFRFKFKVDTKFPDRNSELVKNLADNIVDAMKDLDIYRGVAVEQIRGTSVGSEYDITIKCAMS